MLVQTILRHTNQFYQSTFTPLEMGYSNFQIVVRLDLSLSPYHLVVNIVYFLALYTPKYSPISINRKITLSQGSIVGFLHQLTGHAIKKSTSHRMCSFQTLYITFRSLLFPYQTITAHRYPLHHYN